MEILRISSRTGRGSVAGALRAPRRTRRAAPLGAVLRIMVRPPRVRPSRTPTVAGPDAHEPGRPRAGRELMRGPAEGPGRPVVRRWSLAQSCAWSALPGVPRPLIQRPSRTTSAPPILVIAARVLARAESRSPAAVPGSRAPVPRSIARRWSSPPDAARHRTRPGPQRLPMP